MDQQLKQRLIGVIVLTSLAAIFVPMLFEDPIDASGKLISELKIPDVPKELLTTDSIKIPKNIDDVINLPEPLEIKEQAEIEVQVSQHEPIETITKALSEVVTPAELNRWFLQVGSFGQESNAITLRDKMRKQGFPATISSERGEKGVLYKVKVGPELDKNRAEEMKIKIDKLNNIKSILTSSND